MVFEVLVLIIGTVMSGLLAWIGKELMQMRDAVIGMQHDLRNAQEVQGDHEGRIRTLERAA